MREIAPAAREDHHAETRTLGPTLHCSFDFSLPINIVGFMQAVLKFLGIKLQFSTVDDGSTKSRSSSLPRAVELKEKNEIAHSQRSQPVSEVLSQRHSQQSQYPKRYSKPSESTPPSIPPATQDTTIVLHEDLPDTTTPAVIFTP